MTGQAINPDRVNLEHDGDDELKERYTLTEIDKRLVQLVLSYPDIKETELASILGLSKSETRRRRKKPSVMKSIKEMSLPIHEAFEMCAKDSLHTMRALLKSKSESIRLMSARFFLDYALKTMLPADQNSGEVIFITSVRDDGAIIQSVADAANRAAVIDSFKGSDKPISEKILETGTFLGDSDD